MPKKTEIEVFSTSFLDLLSCGMGGMIILWIIFVASAADANKDTFSFCIVSFDLHFADTKALNTIVLSADGSELASISRTSGVWLASLEGDSFDAEAGKYKSFDREIVGIRRLTAMSFSEGDATLLDPLGNPCDAPLSMSCTLVFKRLNRPVSVQLEIDRKLSQEVAASGLNVEGYMPIGSSATPVGIPSSEAWQLLFCKFGGVDKVIPPYPKVDLSIATPLVSANKTLSVDWGTVSISQTGTLVLEAEIDGRSGDSRIGALYR